VALFRQSHHCNRFRPGPAIAPAIATDARGVAALWKPLYSDGRHHWVERPNELRIHVARRGEQVTVPSRRTVVDEICWVEAKAAT
jgi:hypothetical protein